MDEQVSTEDGAGAVGPADGVQMRGSQATQPHDGETAPAGAPEAAAPHVTVAAAPPSAGRWRLLLAAALLPWLLGYGIAGSWAVARGARAAAEGLATFDAGYSSTATPAGVIVVGALILAAFAALLATSLLLLFGSRSGGAWLAAATPAVVLAAGSAWAGARGGLHLALWLIFFAGLLLAALIGAVQVARVARVHSRGRVARP